MIDGTGSLWAQWGGHTEALVGLIVLELAYLFGVGPLRDRYNLADQVDPKQVATFTTGVLIIGVVVIGLSDVLDALFEKGLGR